MDSEGPLNPVSERSHNNFVSVDYFTNYNVTLSTSKNDACSALETFLHNSISNSGRLPYQITDRGTEDLNTEMASCCTLFK